MFRTNLAIDIGSMRNPRNEGTEGGLFHSHTRGVLGVIITEDWYYYYPR
jgi:hypothetical protein